MDYRELAKEFMEMMHQMHRSKGQKKINDSMQGESFVLFYISEHEGNVIPSDISNAMEISSARIAATLNSLEKKGFIERKIDVEDRRRILIELTEEGKKEANRHQEMVMRITINMLEYLGEQDAKEFVRIMKKLSKHRQKEFNPEEFK
ncbi:MAG: hypothetical protein PWP24_1137 [Clostridiales bacterium]|nr:hypothetical protein [Clostridiales bacterium]